MRRERRSSGLGRWGGRSAGKVGCKGLMVCAKNERDDEALGTRGFGRRLVVCQHIQTQVNDGEFESKDILGYF